MGFYSRRRDFEGQTLFDVKKDDSVFVSVASYRDENCPTTLKEMYSKADHPEKLFIGLVQQVRANYELRGAEGRGG